MALNDDWSGSWARAGTRIWKNAARIYQKRIESQKPNFSILYDTGILVTNKTKYKFKPLQPSNVGVILGCSLSIEYIQLLLQLKLDRQWQWHSHPSPLLSSSRSSSMSSALSCHPIVEMLLCRHSCHHSCHHDLMILKTAVHGEQG